eukprot:684385-Pyramimonas_sp.AAC.1
MEKVVASTSVIVQEIGEMMTKRQFVAFSDSVDGGKLTDVQADRQWAEWLAAIAEPGATWPPNDMKGRGGEQRIWVKTKDIMMLQNALHREKSMTMASKELRNASERDIGEMHKKIQLDHSSMMGGAASLQEGLGAQGSQMIKSGGAECFTNRGIDVPNVEELATPKQDMEVDEAGDGDGGAEDGAGAPGGDGPPAKKPKWFDYDKSVGKARRMYESGQESFVAQVGWTLERASEALHLAGQSSDE